MSDWAVDCTSVSSALTWLCAAAACMVALALAMGLGRFAFTPMLPLMLFKNPVIAICSAAVFVLGIGMFGVIIYLPLFMQGVLGVSPTRSGNLLTPLMMASGRPGTAAALSTSSQARQARKTVPLYRS